MDNNELSTNLAEVGTDCISRQAAIKTVGWYSCHSGDELLFADNALRQLPPIQPEPHWIPVTERLPKDGRQVLVYAMSVHYALAKYDEVRDADGTYKKQWVTFDAWKPYYTIKDVIAWMPLPEPFNGVTE